MDKADVLFIEFAAAVKGKKILEITDVDVDSKCQSFCRLLGSLDVVWSNVRGIDAGLLPTVSQTQLLQKSLSEAKRLWLEMEMTMLQPKWHVTFGGHLLQQAIKHGGLADKADVTIEFQHQVLMKLRDRRRSITSFQKRDSCIRRELRRRRSPETQGHVDICEQSVKRSPNSKRQTNAAERHQENREAKRAKREAILDQDS